MEETVAIYKLNYDKNEGLKALVRALEIKSLPTFMFFRGGSSLGEPVSGAKVRAR